MPKEQLVFPEILNTPEQTLDKREEEYGSFEDNANMTQDLINVVNDYINSSKSTHKIPAVHLQCYRMIFTKIARLTTGDAYHADSAHDIAGYGLLLEKFIKNERK